MPAQVGVHDLAASASTNATVKSACPVASAIVVTSAFPLPTSRWGSTGAPPAGTVD
ncbi:hypothetical protein AB0F72_37515 [Actinoplanes sp. NPDC023936]|uniref:hypothetical protein n=1 Tax=Actinoplanes sp. NPDC023936 TaxID=3154910 RepID=UPI0033DD8B4B